MNTRRLVRGVVLAQVVLGGPFNPHALDAPPRPSRPWPTLGAVGPGTVPAVTVYPGGLPAGGTGPAGVGGTVPGALPGSGMRPFGQQALPQEPSAAVCSRLAAQNPGSMAESTNDRDPALWGYRPVSDGGTKVPSPCGTEEANEGKATGGNKWAKRKFSPGPVNSRSGPGEYQRMAYLDGYEKISTGDKPPYAAWGTEVTNEDKGPGPDWAKRPQKSDPHTGAKSGTQRPVPTDLTAVSLRSVNGESVVQIAEATLRSGESMRAAWDQLEPLVRTLIAKVSAEVERDGLEPGDAGKLLQLCANVVHKVGAASQGMFKASEGMARLSLLLSAGRGTRRSPAEMSQKELAGTLVAALKQLGDDGPCPVCHAQKPIPVAQ